MMNIFNISKIITPKKLKAETDSLDARKVTKGALGRLSEAPGFRGF